MDLTFNKEGKNFVAEFEATADFNLHIERNKGGDILLYVRTQGGGYDIVDDFGVQRHQGVIDYDCTALVYPKFIKIVSEVEPTYAAVVSDGEVTEIKSQSKEIEVTANGTTVVEPDAGFAYLNSVKVKTNVAQSGEGGGSASGDNSRRYFDISSLSSEQARTQSLSMASYIKQEENGVYVVAPLYFVDRQFSSFDAEKVTAICCDTAMPILGRGLIIGIDEAIPTLISSGAIEITREEFYNTDVPEVE